MGHLEFEEDSKVPRDRLFAWYTDFSETDPSIMQRYGQGDLIARQVRRTDDAHIICEQTMKIGRKAIPAMYQITIHPENFTYDAQMRIGQMTQEVRHYEFLEHEGGTKIHVKADYSPKSFGMKLAAALGIYKRVNLRMSRKTMRTYIRAAEDEFLHGA